RALVLDRHGTIHLDTTPQAGSYVQNLFERATQPAGRYQKSSLDGYYTASHATSFDNPRLDPLDLAQIKTEIPEWVWRTEYLAEWVDLGDAVFAYDLLLRLFDHDYPPIAERYDNTKRYAIGVDLAQVQDWTAIIVLDITGKPPYKLAHWRRFRGTPY